LARPHLELLEQVGSAGQSPVFYDGVQRFEPLTRFFRVIIPGGSGWPLGRYGLNWHS